MHEIKHVITIFQDSERENKWFAVAKVHAPNEKPRQVWIDESPSSSDIEAALKIIKKLEKGK